MEDQPQPSSSGRPTTRSMSSTRKRPASAAAGAATGGTPLRSPTLAAFFSAQPRKQARTQPPTLRQIRKKGGGVPATLSGYLGLLPDEVSARRRRPPAPTAGPWAADRLTPVTHDPPATLGDRLGRRQGVQQAGKRP